MRIFLNMRDSISTCIADIKQSEILSVAKWVAGVGGLGGLMSNVIYTTFISLQQQSNHISNLREVISSGFNCTLTFKYNHRGHLIKTPVICNAESQLEADAIAQEVYATAEQYPTLPEFDYQIVAMLFMVLSSLGLMISAYKIKQNRKSHYQFSQLQQQAESKAADNLASITTLAQTAEEKFDLKSMEKIQILSTPFFLCPISKKTMRLPVIASDGYTYNATSIIEHINNNGTSPRTGEQLNRHLIHNRVVSQAMDLFASNNIDTEQFTLMLTQNTAKPSLIILLLKRTAESTIFAIKQSAFHAIPLIVILAGVFLMKNKINSDAIFYRVIGIGFVALLKFLTMIVSKLHEDQSTLRHNELNNETSAASLAHLDEKMVFNFLNCPISHTPEGDFIVLQTDGWSYGQKNLRQWLARRSIAPLSNKPVDSAALMRPNRWMHSILNSSNPLDEFKPADKAESDNSAHP